MFRKSRRVGVRVAAVGATALMLVPFGAAARAGSEYVCEDVWDDYLEYYYEECEWIETPDAPEFEDLITDVRVKDVTVGKAAQTGFVVDVYFDDPGFGYTFDDPEVYLVSAKATYLTSWLDLEEVAPGHLQASGYYTSEAQTGLWWVQGFDISVDYDNGDSSWFLDMDTNWDAYYVKRNTTLSLNASPEPARKGSAITVAGTLKRLNPGDPWDLTDAYYSAYSGKTIKIYFDPKGTLPKKYMGSTTTNSKGNYSKKFTAKVDGTWSAQFAGTSNYVAKKSTGDFVDVR